MTVQVPEITNSRFQISQPSSMIMAPSVESSIRTESAPLVPLLLELAVIFRSFWALPGWVEGSSIFRFRFILMVVASFFVDVPFVVPFFDGSMVGSFTISILGFRATLRLSAS